MRNITAVILCGGLGTRLRSVISDRPKCLVEVNGKPFIYYILDQINSAGIKEVVLAVDYKWELIYNIVGINYKDLSIDYSLDQVKQGGTGAALRSALPYTNNSIILVMNGDTYVDIELNDFIHYYHSGYGNTSFILNLYDGIISMGVCLTYREFVQGHIPVGLPYSLEKSFLKDTYEYGIIPYVINKPFIDIGTPESYAVAGAFIYGVGK